MSPPVIPIAERFNEYWMPVTESGCWVWMASFFRNGYGRLKVCGKNRGAHRISWELHRGPIPDDFYVCHSCDVRACVNPDHLFLGTALDNLLDRNAKGRSNQVRGNRVAGSVLRSQDVIFIRSSKATQRALARLFGVSQSTIGDIRRRKKWAHL